MKLKKIKFKGLLFFKSKKSNDSRSYLEDSYKFKDIFF